MKKRPAFGSLDIIFIILLIIASSSFVFLCIDRPNYIIPTVILILIAITIVLLWVEWIRKKVYRFLGGKSTQEELQKSGLNNLVVPMLVLKDKRIVWYNEAFCEIILKRNDEPLSQINRIIPGFDIKTSATPEGQNIQIDTKNFSVYGSVLTDPENLYCAVFIDNTELKQQAKELITNRPSVLYIEVDTYEEVLKDLRETERTQIMSRINTSLENLIAKTGGFMRRINSARHIAVIDDASLQKIIDTRFEILNTIRSGEEDAALISLSIGVGRGGKNLKESEDMAQQALSMALGRGGDQAAVKTPDGYEFYGGVSRSVEKRNRVKSRIVANSIKELLKEVDRVLIMGHMLSDMDSVGAATGMLRFCKICNKEAFIVLNKEKTMATSLINYLVDGGYGNDIISPSLALPLTGKKTLLIIVDTHMANRVESPLVYDNSDKIVVIDHHRKMVGHIDNATIFYHEPYASSASELVSELLPYAGDNNAERPTPLDAEALLAGIMLDTRTFSLHVGVRTFEAAAYLRRLGAETEVVKKMFSSTLSEYIMKSKLVEEAEIVEHYAIVVSDEIPAEYEVAAPQAANDLLGIEGVRASIVAIKKNNNISISARSLGEVNVQLIMEKLGGGGHLTMSGAQLKDTTIKEAKNLILKALLEYKEENSGNENSINK